MNKHSSGILLILAALTFTGCDSYYKSSKSSSSNPRVERRLDDIQAQLTMVSEQLDDINISKPVPSKGISTSATGLTLKPIITVKDIDTKQTVKATKKELLIRNARRTPPKRTVVARKKKVRKKRTTYADLARKHIRIPVSVIEVQKALQAAGCNPGKIDGKVGRDTISAIRKFQTQQGLTVDGVVGGKTWEKLNNAASTSEFLETTDIIPAPLQPLEGIDID